MVLFTNSPSKWMVLIWELYGPIDMYYLFHNGNRLDIVLPLRQEAIDYEIQWKCC